jgi:predicted NUDIX family NTP pyrophosphohydrolase
MGHGKTKCGAVDVQAKRKNPRSLSCTSGRSLLGKKGSRRVVHPKGEYADGENPLATARREFEEETGMKPEGKLIPLGEIKQPGGKLVRAWAFEGDYDPSKLRSNSFTMEWPKKSGIKQAFPEIDRGGWFPIAVAKAKLLAGQTGFLDHLVSKLPTEKNH